MGQLQKYNDDFVLFLESGFIAANQADEDAAVKLFRASQLLRPEQVLPKIGFGYIHLLKLELKQACQIFEEVLKQEPHHDMARALLGLSTSLTIKSVDKGVSLLEEALKRADDQAIKNMATTALEFVEKFIKKGPTPINVEPGKKPKKKKGKT